MAANVYPKENLNGIRISKIIVDVGTQILQERLIDVITNKEKEFEKYLRNKANVYNSIGDYLEKRRTDFSNNFFPDQIKAMYTNNKASKTSNEFDLTLCLNLYKDLLYSPKKRNSSHGATVISAWSSEPAYDDESFTANLVRLKIFRDKNYGHISKSNSFNEKEMERLSTFESKKAKYPNGYSFLAKLEFAIYGLCKDTVQKNAYKNKIDECMQNAINDPKVVDRYKSLISNLIAKDQEANEMILKQIENLNEKDEKVLTLIKENRQIGKNNYEKIKNNQKNLFKILNKLNINVEQLFDKIYDISFDEKLSAITTSLVTLHQQNEENHTELKDEFKEVKELIETKLSNNTNMLNCPEINIEDFKGYFDEDSEYNIRILFLDIGQSTVYDTKKLAKSIGLSNWNVIIDLSVGLKEFSLEVCKHFEKNHIRIKISDLNKRITSSDMACVMRGEWACYIECNEDNEENSSIDIEKIDDEIMSFIEKFKSNQRTFMCTNFYLKFKYTEADLKTLDVLNKAVKRAIYRISKKEILELVYLIFSDLNNLELSREIQRVLDEKLKNVEKKICITNSNQFLTAMTPTHLNSEEEFKLPANQSEIIWSKKENNMYASFVQVYHKTIGKINFKNENECKKFVENKKFNFIIGNEIDPETIFINDEMAPVKQATYVETSLVKKIFDKIDRKSKKKDFYKNNPLIHNIYHNPYCGGTTIARVLLYRLRLQLPCIRILYIDQEDKLIEILSYISFSSDLPLVILIDTDTLFGDNNETIKEANVEELSRRLINIRHFIIFVQRSFVENSIPKLEEEEIESFEALYKDYLAQNKKLKNKKYCFYKDLVTIRLLCLRNSEDTKKTIDGIATTYLQSLSDKDKTLLILIYFYDKFGYGRYFNTNLIAFILDKPMKEILKLFQENVNSESDTETFKIFHLLSYNRKNSGFKMLSMDLSKRLVELIAENEKKNPIKVFFDKFINLIKKIASCDDSPLNEALKKVTTVLIISNKEVRNRIKLKIQSQEQDDEDETSNANENFARQKSNNRDSSEEENEKAVEINANDEKDVSNFYSKLIFECKKAENLGKMITEKIFKTIFHLFVEADHDIAPLLGCVYARFVFHNNETIKRKNEAIEISKKALKFEDSIKDSRLDLSENLYCMYGDLIRHYVNTYIHDNTYRH
jgi:hypothetical protein